MGLGIELLVFPFSQVIPATNLVTDTQQDISVTQPKEVGAGYILVQGNSLYAMREQIANVLPFAIEGRGLCDPRMLATKNGVVGIVFNPSEWIPGSVLVVVCIAWLSTGCNSVQFLPVIQVVICLLYTSPSPRDRG